MSSLTLYGGVGEIGGNKILLEHEKTRVFLDFGMSFTAESRYFEFPLLQPTNIDDLLKTKLIPTLSGLYKNAGLCAEYDYNGVKCIRGEAGGCCFNGVLLSHAHMDHYGYLGLLRPDIPILASTITKKLLQLRADISEEWNTKINHEMVKIIKNGESTELGALTIRRFDVDHSVLGASAFIIYAGDATIAYTGDIRFHGSATELSENFISALKKEDVDVLLCEGTRIALPKNLDEQEVESHVLHSEEEVEQKSLELIKKESGLIIYDASPVDMNRMCILKRVADETGRKLIFDSKKAYLITYLNYQEGECLCSDLPDPGNFKIYLGRSKLASNTKKYKALDVEDIFVEAFVEGRRNHESNLLIAQRKTGYGGSYKAKEGDDGLVELPDDSFIWGPLRDEVLANQGEYIVYTSNGPLTLLHFLRSDTQNIHGTFIYGKAEPFNEEMEFSFERLRNWLELCNLKLEYAHTSGHADEENIKRLIAEANPKTLIPIHTEHPEFFLDLAPRVILPELGEKYEL